MPPPPALRNMQRRAEAVPVKQFLKQELPVPPCAKALNTVKKARK
jgi:hypothetical protein